MIVKILGSASSNFHGVQYNDKKVEKGTGELMLMKNFPSFINENSSQEQVRDYFKSVSKNEKVKKPQFHAVISTKFREHSKEELAKIAEDFMQEMNYGNQPFIVVFHNDTENNHVHIVSTRVDKTTGKKINDSHEKLKAQKALSHVLEKKLGENVGKRIDELLDYKIGSINQLELLMQRQGFRIVKNTNDENSLDILKNGVREKTINGNQIVFENRKNDSRSKQLKAILSKYKNLCSNKVFKVEDRRHLEKMLPEEKQKEDWKPKIEFESELQKKLRDIFGIDVVFHHKDGRKPFGYTMIDHNTRTVFKGSEIMKMNDLFEFTSETMNKRLFEQLKDFNISDEASKQVLILHLKRKNHENVPKDFMLFETTKRKDKQTFISVKIEVKEYLKTQNKNDVKLIKSEDGKYYAIHSKLHYVGELEKLIGEKEYQKFLNPTPTETSQENKNLSKELNRSINDLIFEFSKSSGSGKDPTEDELRKKRKKKSR
ncbi:Relaxase/Mobilisation nuclease domain-containing protein [Chryseobacterium piscicola]|uniref:Mobilization protein n=1 Tax=Chryseobacterium piscicola TaxID=551459 RepID=A0A1N7KR15_9FLAO|nr:relaxase/mobilization nuclease domain-containing protein [Chryseobacterium piscicola]PQA94964.1 mobilization protein [Chryseobacterium piscicola]SIS63995.1 Relaxase/Mobilisation nuclease domain-containing protein [Chryseobacterium piscicola]